jgi:hypothetical protein
MTYRFKAQAIIYGFAITASLSTSAAQTHGGRGYIGASVMSRDPAGQVVGAQSVRITNAKGTWLQVSEVVAIDAHTGANVAASANGGWASAPNEYEPGPAPASNANDEAEPFAHGFYDVPGIYHSGGEGAGNYLDVNFAQPTDLAALTIYGRTDCCSERDVYRYEIRNGAGVVLRSGIIRADNRAHSGTAKFAVPTRLRP